MTEFSFNRNRSTLPIFMQNPLYLFLSSNPALGARLPTDLFYVVQLAWYLTFCGEMNTSSDIGATCDDAVVGPLPLVTQ